ncbi:hypothetical protein [Tumebacillus flagellatus]|uniref:Uncharacterized protein n=1 Tax=Tumebacillus flagellatus TaxID=1157490 RepID=A0A074MA98_9BACL|nr:hypothetical protein [Tumebacillus flagellatus]KEO82872.1 hypothetical protein EL26_13270 [Tumebacillus flagellatus]
MDYQDYLTAIQTIAYEYIPNEQPLTREAADQLGARLLGLTEPLNPLPKHTTRHQTVICYREKGNWVPVTIHFQTTPEGTVRYARIHAPSFIKEYGEEQF